MGFRYRKRLYASRNAWLNVSKTGVSGSLRTGRITANTRGTVFVLIAKGLSWFGKR